MSRRISYYPENQVKKMINRSRHILLILPLLLFAGLLLLSPATGHQDNPQLQGASKVETIHDVYWKGVRIFTMEGLTTLGDGTYHHRSDMRTRGILRLFLKAIMEIEAGGALTEDGIAAPKNYRSWSSWNKRIWERVIEFNEAGQPLSVKVNVPEDNDGDREPVPLELQAAPDPYSLFVSLMADPWNVFEEVGTMEAKPIILKSFDGSRAMEYALDCGFPHKKIKSTRKSSFKGEAYYCEVGLKQTGGFWHGEDDETDEAQKKDDKKSKKRRGRNRRGDNDDDEDEQQPLKIWFAKSQELQIFIPVRMEFNSGRGILKIYLKESNQTLVGPDFSRRKTSP